jgi:hypothetical protein
MRSPRWLVIVAVSVAGCADVWGFSDLQVPDGGTPGDASIDSATLDVASVDAPDGSAEPDGSPVMDAPEDGPPVHDAAASADGSQDAAAGVCEPGQTQECNTYGTRGCDGSGQWGQCSCPSNPIICTPGDTYCNSGYLRRCDSCGQAWGSSGTC